MQVKKVTIEYENGVVITGPSLESVNFLCKVAVQNVTAMEEDVWAEGMKRNFDPHGDVSYSDNLDATDMFLPIAPNVIVV